MYLDVVSWRARENNVTSGLFELTKIEFTLARFTVTYDSMCASPRWTWQSSSAPAIIWHRRKARDNTSLGMVRSSPENDFAGRFRSVLSLFATRGYKIIIRLLWCVLSAWFPAESSAFCQIWFYGLLISLSVKYYEMLWNHVTICVDTYMYIHENSWW